MAKYFYKDSKGKIKKYNGKIIERDGKFFGKLITPIITPTMVKLDIVDEHKEIKDTIINKVWKDRDGVEHELTGLEFIKDNNVVHKYEDKFELKFNPGKEDEIWFSYQGKRYDNVEERNGKFYAKK